jgi:NADH-quinone oxidoreductase subunit G
MAFAQLVEAVPFYKGLTLETIGGRGVRWPEREEAREHPSAEPRERPEREERREDPSAEPREHPSAEAREHPSEPREHPSAEPLPAPAPERHPPPAAVLERRRSVEADGALRLGTYRPIWAAPEVELSPVLQYTIARQLLELSPEDARLLGLTSGESVVVSQNGTQLQATAHVRTGVPAGTAFLAEGLASDSANVFTGLTITVAKGGRESGHIDHFLDQPPRGEAA